MKPVCCRPRVSRGFAALIEIIIVAALILGGVMLYMNMNKGITQTQKDLDAVSSGKLPTTASGSPLAVTNPTSLAGQAIRRASSEGCESNLRQIRMLIQSYQTDHSCFPASLTELPDSIKIRSCPVSKADYDYNPTTGEIHCTCPGHEKY